MKADKELEIKGEIPWQTDFHDKILTWDAVTVEGGRPYIDPHSIKSITIKIEAGECAYIGVECYRKLRKSEKITVSTPMTEWTYFPVQSLHVKTRNMCSCAPEHIAKLVLSPSVINKLMKGRKNETRKRN